MRSRGYLPAGTQRHGPIGAGAMSPGRMPRRGRLVQTPKRGSWELPGAHRWRAEDLTVYRGRESDHPDTRGREVTLHGHE